MSLLRARLRPTRLSSAVSSFGTAPVLSHSTATLHLSFKRPLPAQEHHPFSRRVQQRVSILSLSRHPTHRFASTDTAQPTSTPAPYPSSTTSQPAQPSSPPPLNSSNAAPATIPSTSSTPITTTPPTTPITTLPSPSPATTPLAAALSAELSSLPPPPPPSPTASFLARPFITALQQYPLPLLLALATLELSSFSLTNQLLTAAGVVFSSTFAWAYLISVPIRRSAIVKAVIGVPLGVVVGVVFPWFKEIRITELRRKSAR